MTKGAEEEKNQTCSPAPTGNALRHSFNKLWLEDPPRQAKGSASPLTLQRVYWHQSATSTSSVTQRQLNYPRTIQVQEVSSPLMVEEVKIFEEFVPAPSGCTYTISSHLAWSCNIHYKSSPSDEEFYAPV